MKKRLIIFAVLLALIFVVGRLDRKFHFFDGVEKEIYKVLQLELPEQFKEEELSNACTNVIEKISNNKYEEVVAMISDKASGLSAESMRNFLHPKIVKNGNLLRVVKIKFSGVKKGNNNLAKTVITAEYQKGSMKYELLWDENLKIAGFSLR